MRGATVFQVGRRWFAAVEASCRNPIIEGALKNSPCASFVSLASAALHSSSGMAQLTFQCVSRKVCSGGGVRRTIRPGSKPKTAEPIVGQAFPAQRWSPFWRDSACVGYNPSSACMEHSLGTYYVRVA